MEDGLVISSALAFLAEIVNLVMILVTSLEKSDDVVDVISDHFLRHLVGRITHRDDTLRLRSGSCRRRRKKKRKKHRRRKKKQKRRSGRKRVEAGKGWWRKKGKGKK